MNSVKLRNAMASARGVFIIERILHLGVMGTDDAEVNEAFEPFLSDFDEHTARDLADRIDLKHLVEIDDDEELLSEFLCACDLQERYGFLCYVRTPKVTNSSRSGKSYSWGLSYCRWFYGDDLAEIIAQADAWAVSSEKDEKEEPGSDTDAEREA